MIKKKSKERYQKFLIPITPHHGLRAFYFSAQSPPIFGTKENKKNGTNILMIKFHYALNPSHKSPLT
jgi:hypothetical protein